MARKRMTETAEMTEFPQTESSANDFASTDRRKRPKVIIPLNFDGTPDLSRVDPAVLEAIRNQTEPDTAEPIAPEVAEMAISLIANIEAMILASQFDVPQNQALSLTLPPEPIKTQMSQAAAKVMTKYSGALGKYQDEIVLGAMVAAWQIGVLNQFRAIKAMKEKVNPPVITETPEKT